jgi:hypothetical protein
VKKSRLLNEMHDTARGLNTSVSTVQKWEIGEKRPSTEAPGHHGSGTCPRSCWASWIGDAPNRRRYSRLNWEGLS